MGKLIAYRPTSEDPSELSDEALVAACGTNDPTALALLFRRHSAALQRFLSRLAGVDARDLEDLVQATFIAVNTAAAGFRGTSSVRTWILGIAANIVGKHVRGELRRRTLRTKIAEIPREPIRGPDQQAEHNQTLARLEAALADLPHDLRAAFVLCVIESVPGKDAAEVLGIREGTLWRRLHEARVQLRQAVEGT